MYCVTHHCSDLLIPQSLHHFTRTSQEDFRELYFMLSDDRKLQEPSILCALETINIRVIWRRKGETPLSWQDTKRISLQVSSKGLQPYQILKSFKFLLFLSCASVYLAGWFLFVVSVVVVRLHGFYLRKELVL